MAGKDDVATIAGPPELLAITAKINALLPPRYQGCFERVSPTSMGSASLKFGADGKVAWQDIWTSFCHLALAGGPPHRGTLLEPVPAEQVTAEPEAYRAVVAEIERAVGLTTELATVLSPTPGWVGVRCLDEEMAAWLLRAIVVENISVRRDQEVLYLPAGPRFRLEKEIKNVVTALAKTCHYWCDHLSAEQRPRLADVPLLGPAPPAEVYADAERYRDVVADLERGLQSTTGLPPVSGAAPGWVGVQCESEEMAVAVSRVVIVENILARREDSVLCLPAGVHYTRTGEVRQIVTAVAMGCYYWRAYRHQAAL